MNMNEQMNVSQFYKSNVINRNERNDRVEYERVIPRINDGKKIILKDKRKIS